MELYIWLPAALFVAYLMFGLYKERRSDLDKRETHERTDTKGEGY